VSGRNVPGKVLVVDDHLDLAENLAEILEGVGYQAVVAGSAEEALERVAAGDIAAVVTDFRLPGRNGVELLAELNRRDQRLPAVVISAFTDEKAVEEARRAGAADVLVKPVPLDRLMTVVGGFGVANDLVLIVDDNHDLAQNLAEAMEARGHRTAVCGSLAEARALAGTPTVAVLDYRLPDGTGVDVAKDLLKRSREVRILFISGYGPLADSELGDTGGAAAPAQLDKPVDVERLLAWVAEAIGHGPTAPAGR
jgi:DNA-binding NtrC family response regulator